MCKQIIIILLLLKIRFSLCRVCVLDFVIILQGSYVIRCTCPADDFDKNEYGSLILGVFV